MKFTIVLEPQEEGGYTVYVPSLKGCISEGDSKEEALRNITDFNDLINYEGEKIELTL